MHFDVFFDYPRAHLRSEQQYGAHLCSEPQYGDAISYRTSPETTMGCPPTPIDRSIDRIDYKIESIESIEIWGWGWNLERRTIIAVTVIG